MRPLGKHPRARATQSLEWSTRRACAPAHVPAPRPAAAPSTRAQLYMVESTLPTCALPTGMPLESSASPSTSQPPAEPKLTQ